MLLAALGGGEGHRLAGRAVGGLLLLQPGFKLVAAALGEGLHQHVPGDEVAVLVVLGDELRQHLAGILAALAGEGEVVAADHASAADVENVYHRVQAVLGQGDDVLFAAVGLDGNLPFHQALHVADFIPQRSGSLVLHLGGAVHHVLAQHLQHLVVIAAQEGQHAVHHVPVFRLGALAGAGGHALADLIIDAGAGGILQRQLLAAGAQGKYAAHRLDHLADRRRADVGPEVLHAVLGLGALGHAAGQFKPGEGLLQVDTQIRIMLVILEEDVVVGFVQLDEVALQAQGLQVGGAQEDVEIVNVGDHRGHLGGMLGVTEIGAHPVFEVHRLADVDDRALRVLHEVAAGGFGQHGDLGLQLFAPIDFSHGEDALLSYLRDVIIMDNTGGSQPKQKSSPRGGAWDYFVTGQASGYSSTA